MHTAFHSSDGSYSATTLVKPSVSSYQSEGRKWGEMRGGIEESSGDMVGPGTIGNVLDFKFCLL